MNNGARERRLQVAEGLLARLTLGDYSIEEQEGGWIQFYVPNHRRGRHPRLKFGSILCRLDGQVTVYANGDFDDPDGRFTRQRSNHRDGHYTFNPNDNEEAWTYAARVVLSAYNSRV